MTKQLNNSITLVIILAFLYFITGKISLLFLHGIDIVNIGIFAAEGISLGFILSFGKRVVAGIFIGQLLLALSFKLSLEISLYISAINSIEALIGYLLFNYFNLNIKLKSFKDIFGLIGIIFFIQIFSASFGNIILVLNGVVESQNYLTSAFSWWFGNTMGQILFTPFVLLLISNYKKIDFYNLTIYSVFFTALIYVLEISLNIQNALLLLSISIPIIIFIVSHKGFTYGVTLSVVLAIVSSYSLYLGDGAFNGVNLTDNIMNYNLYILTHILMVLVAGILFEERKQYILILKDQVSKEVIKNKEQELLLLKQLKFAQMGEMISIIAHQWRQPLNNLSLSNQLLISKYRKGKLDDTAINTFKDNSKIQITHMSKTIDDFRNFFKPDKTKQNFNVNDVISELIHITNSLYEVNTIKIDFSFTGEFISYGYANELGQAILNILNNAKDALLKKEQEEKFINITLTNQNDKVSISIEDNAGGIPEEIIPKIFDSYFSTKSKENGTGLGLYMTKMIIEDKLNGEINVINTQHGAKFEILLEEKKECL